MMMPYRPRGVACVHNERRALPTLSEYGIVPRQPRGRHLTDPWIGDRWRMVQRSWKRYRKTQYHVVDMGVGDAELEG